MLNPVCGCHGERMRWAKDSRLAAGGYWRCRVKAHEYEARYNRSNAGRERRRRYDESPRGQVRRDLYHMTRVRAYQ